MRKIMKKSEVSKTNNNEEEEKNDEELDVNKFLEPAPFTWLSFYYKIYFLAFNFIAFV